MNKQILQNKIIENILANQIYHLKDNSFYNSKLIQNYIKYFKKLQAKPNKKGEIFAGISSDKENNRFVVHYLEKDQYWEPYEIVFKTYKEAVQYVKKNLLTSLMTAKLYNTRDLFFKNNKVKKFLSYRNWEILKK